MRFLAAVLALSLAAGAGDEPKVWVHAPAEDLVALFPEKGAGFLISKEEYEKLLDLAKRNAEHDAEQPPLPARLVKGSAQGRVEGDLLRLEAHYVAVVNGDRPVEVPFLLRNAALERVAVEGGELLGDALRFDRAGTYMVTAQVSHRLEREGDVLKGSFRLPAAAGQTVVLDLPPQVEGEVGPIVRAFRTGDEGGQVVGYPDRDGVFTLWTSPRTRVRELEPLLSASFATIASLGEAQILTSTNVELEVLRAPVPSVTLLLPRGQLVRALNGKGVKTWRIERGGEGGDRLEVLFVDPLQDKVELAIEGELKRGGEETVDVPLVRVPGAVRTRGTVGLVARPEVRIKSIEAEGARRLERQDDSLAVFQVWSERSRVRAAVERVAATTKALTQATLAFQEGGKRLSVLFRYTIAGEPLFRLEPALPAGWILRQLALDGQPMEHRYEDDGRVVLVFPQGLAPGAHALQAVLDTDEVDWVPNEGTVELALAGIRSGLDEERGHLVVASDPAFRVGVRETNGLETVGMREVYGARPAPESVLYAWRFDRAGWGVRFRLERNRPQIAATVVSRVLPSERLLATHATVLLDIQRTGVRELEIALPKGAGPLVDFRGALIKEKRAPAEGADPETWTLVFEKRIRGAYRLDVLFDRKFEEDAWSAPFPEIAVPGAQERGFLVVYAGATTAVKVEAKDLRAADVDELPVPAERPPLEVLAYARHPYEVAISSRRHDPHDVVQAVALSAHIYGVLAPDGRLRCRAEYRIRNNDQPFLPFGLPEGSALVGALVDGQPTKPLVEKGWLMVPLPRSRDRETPFLVSVIYETEVDPLGGGGKGDVEVARPLLLIDVLKTTYTLHLPQGWRLTGHDGDLVPLDRGRRETVLGDLADVLGPTLIAKSAAGSAPGSGVFFNDGADGDFRGRAESKKLDDARRKDVEKAAARTAAGEELRRAREAEPAAEKAPEEEIAEAIEVLEDRNEVDSEDGLVDRPLAQVARAGGAGKAVGGKTPKPGAPPSEKRERPERALLSLDVQFLKPDNVVRLDSLAPSGAVRLSLARADVFAVRTYLGAVLGAAAALLLLFRPRLSLLRVFPAAVLAIVALHFAGLSFLSADFAVGAGRAVVAILALALLARLGRLARRLRWPFRRKAVAAVALLLAAAGARAQEVLVPYTGDEPTGEIRRVFLPADEYHRLREAAYPDAKGRRTAFAKAEYSARLDKEELTVAALYEIAKETDEAERIPLRLNGVAVTFAELDGRPATLAVEEEGYVLVLRGKGRHALELTLRPRLEAKGEARSFRAPVMPVPGARLTLVHDREGHDVAVVGLGGKDGDVHSIGPVATLGATWTPKTEGFRAEEAELRADTEMTVAVRDGFTAAAARLRFSISGGEVQRLRARVGKDLVVRAARCEEMAGWEVDADGVLTVVLEKPATGSRILEVLAERPAAQREREEAVPWVEPLGVLRDAGVIAIETLPDLKIEILEAQGLLRGVAGQAPKDLPAAPDAGALHSVHRFAVRPFALRWRVGVEETRLRAETNVDLFLAKEQATALVVAKVEVERGPGPFEVRLRVPAGWEVERVQAPVRDWWVEDGVLVLARAARQQPEESYTVLLRRGGATATAFEAPAVSVAGAVREQGRLRIGAADGLELEAAEATSLLPEDIAKSKEPWVKRAYRFVSVPWRLVVSTREEPREVEALVVSRLLPLADRVRVEALVHFHVRRGLVDEVTFTVPVAGETEVLVSAPDLREERSEAVPGGRRFTLQLRSPTRGSIAAAVSYALPDDAPVRGVEPEGVARVRRYVAVEKVPDGQVRVTAPENLEDGDFDDLPLKPAGSSAQTVAAVLVGTGEPFGLRVAVERHSFEEVAPAMIYRASAQVVVARSGWTRALVSYRVYNRTEQFLRLRLPEGARLYSVFVAGEGVRPLVEGDALLVPLRKLAIGAPTFDVDVVYAWSGAAVGEKDFDARLPEVDGLDVRRTTLSLWVPDGYAYSFDTEMDEVDEGKIAAGEVSDIYDEAKELWAVAERGNARQAQRAFANFEQLEREVQQLAEKVQAAGDDEAAKQVEAQQRGLAALRGQAPQEPQGAAMVQILDAQQDKAPSIQQWDVNAAYLERYKAAENKDLKDFGERRKGGPQTADMPQLGAALRVDMLAEEATYMRPSVNTVIGLGGGAGGSGGGADNDAGGATPPAAPATPPTPVLFFSSHREDGVSLNPDPADPQGTRNVRLFAFDVEPHGKTLEPQALSGAKGRISIRIDLPKEGKVFHFQRLGAKTGLTCEASEEGGAFLEGLLAVLCSAGALLLLRPKRA